MKLKHAFLVLAIFFGCCFPIFTNAQQFATYSTDYLCNIFDLYTLPNGGYVSCGYHAPIFASFSSLRSQLWVMKVDENLEEVWSNSYGQENAGEGGLSIIEVDAGGYLVGGSIRTDTNHLAAWRIEADGDLIWSNTYGNTRCYSVIELKNGCYLLAGYRGGDVGPICGAVKCIDDEGNQLWSEEYYADQRAGKFSQMRETDGGVVVVGTASESGQIWAVKFDHENEGREIWSNVYDMEFSSCAYSIVADTEGGFLACGGAYFGNQRGYDRWIVCKISNDGNLDWFSFYDMGENNEEINQEYASDIERISADEYVITGQVSSSTVGMLRIDSEGHEYSRHVLDEIEELNIWELTTTVKSNNGGVVIGGNCYALEGEDELALAFISEYAPIIEAPQFLRWSPEDTVLTALQGDTIIYSAYAEDQQGDDISSSWFVADTLFMQGDTTITVVYDSLGVFQTECRMSDGNHISSITWHITVDDFFIRETRPDTLHITARRGSTRPFTLDIACVEPDAPTIEWSVINRDNDREYLGEADSIDVCFDLAGEWAVEAEAIWGEERESVRWAVDVRSAVWWWMPHEEAISVNQNERCEFSIFPFEPDSDSLSVGWWMDGDSLETNTEALSLDFPDLGEHSLTTIVRDGVDADTISWQITVNSSGLENDFNGLPFELALYPPAPNPFNSTTTIGYSLPAAIDVGLAVYELSGREVARLADGVKAIGVHEAVWNADGMASGVYVVRLNAGSVMLREKVVLVK